MAYARGQSASFPHAESVSMALGGTPVKAVDDIVAALSNRETWRTCPANWEGYAAASCPIDLLGPIVAARTNGFTLVLEPELGDVTCSPTRTGPVPPGRLVVIRPRPEMRTCASDFALALVADDHGLLHAVDLTLSAP
ncbi:hypothetical protein SAMN04489844_3204 [Nocardioides exalbidus]|uniref:Uncharacterized protein n=1 Tax=Nocardioides exalbidus TaxID=402596 RepID=A0A1H4W7T9_9ACTN|nr:hypothetical protein [Nocardioides exalbidus]SEC89442.1 hypothetical protein SAMN04489844_3204 [Nocardioides exalbidus]